MKMIDKVGAAIVMNKKILVVRKKTADNRAEYIIPGGRREHNETDLETLERELKEELNVSILSHEFLGSFDDIAIFEGIPIHMQIYKTQISGAPSPSNEIKEYVWIDKNYKTESIQLGSVLEKFVIPTLEKTGDL